MMRLNVLALVGVLVLFLTGCQSAAPVKPIDFSATLMTSWLSVEAGQEVQNELRIRPENGFAGKITLGLMGSVPKGITLETTETTLSGSGPHTQTITFKTTRSVVAGDYSFQLMLKAGNLSHAVPLKVTVQPAPPQGFQVELLSDNLAVAAGGSTSVKLKITPENGLEGQIQLSFGDQMKGLLTTNPQVVEIHGTQTATTEIIVQASSAMQIGLWSGYLYLKAGELTRAVPLTLHILSPLADFTWNPTSNALVVEAGSQVDYSAQVSTTSSFTNRIILFSLEGAPEGISLLKTSQEFVSAPRENIPMNLPVSVAPEVPAGVYNLIFTAQSLTLIKTFPLQITVLKTSKPYFSVNFLHDKIVTAPDRYFEVKMVLTSHNGFTGPVHIVLGGSDMNFSILTEPSSHDITLLAGQTQTIRFIAQATPQQQQSSFAVVAHAQSADAHRELHLPLEFAALPPPTLTGIFEPAELELQPEQQQKIQLRLTAGSEIVGNIDAEQGSIWTENYSVTTPHSSFFLDQHDTVTFDTQVSVPASAQAGTYEVSVPINVNGTNRTFTFKLRIKYPSIEPITATLPEQTLDFYQQEVQDLKVDVGFETSTHPDLHFNLDQPPAGIYLETNGYSGVLLDAHKMRYSIYFAMQSPVQPGTYPLNLQIRDRYQRLLATLPFTVHVRSPVSWIKQLDFNGMNDSADVLSLDSQNNLLVGTNHWIWTGETTRRQFSLRKYSPEGGLLWNKTYPDTWRASVKEIVTDASGHVYVLGDAEGNLPGQKPVGALDLFMLKLDPAGNIINTLQWGTAAADVAQRMKMDTEGNLIVFASTEGSFPGFTNAGQSDLVVIKLNPAGQSLWINQFGTAKQDGNFWFSSNTLLKGGLVVQGTTIYGASITTGVFPGQSNPGGTDQVLFRMDSTGKLVWLKQHHVDSENLVSDLIYTNNRLFLTGEVSLLGGNSQFYWASFDPILGDRTVEKQIGTTSSDHLMCVAPKTNGNLLMAGFTAGYTGNYLSDDEENIYVFEFTSSGKIADFRYAGTSGIDMVQSCLITPNNELILSGSTTGAFPAYSLQGFSDAHVIKLIP